MARIGVVSGPIRRSTMRVQAAGVTAAIRGQPPRTDETMPCGATVPTVCRSAYSTNHSSRYRATSPARVMALSYGSR